MLKVKWTDKVSNEEILQRILEDEICLCKNIQKHKLDYAGHVLHDFSREITVQMLERNLITRVLIAQRARISRHKTSPY